MESIAEIRRQLFADDPNSSAIAHVSEQNIMIIDDNLDILEALTSLLKDHYRLVTCLSYQEAKEALNAEIKVVLLDIKMAGKDGVEAFRLLKQERRNLQVIFHSAYAGSSETANAVRYLNHSGYLTKGEYNASELMNIIEAGLNHQNAPCVRGALE
jgi:CheY-like chemotaxis protein